MLETHRRHPGASPLRHVLEARSIVGEPDSPAESWLGDLIVRHGLPAPVLHHLLTVTSGTVYELDCSYRERLLAFELDGYGVHLRSYDAFEGDRHRRNELELDGWMVLNFTKRMVTHRPHTVIDHIERALKLKQRHL